MTRNENARRRSTLRRLDKASKGVMLVLLLLTSTLFAGCSTFFGTKLHPLTDKDIFFLEHEDQTVTCFSDYYLDEVMKVKLETD